MEQCRTGLGILCNPPALIASGEPGHVAYELFDGVLIDLAADRHGCPIERGTTLPRELNYSATYTPTFFKEVSNRLH